MYKEELNEKPKIYFHPCLIVLTAPPLHGKTTLAQELTKKSNLLHLDVDQFRNIIDPDYLRREGIIPNKEEELQVVNEANRLMCIAAQQRVFAGRPVILSATFSTDERKVPLFETIENLKQRQIPTSIFYLIASEEEIERRIQRRKLEGGVSNIKTLKDYLWTRDSLYKPFIDIQVTEINTENPNDIELILKQLDFLIIK